MNEIKKEATPKRRSTDMGTHFQIGIGTSISLKAILTITALFTPFVLSGGMAFSNIMKYQNTSSFKIDMIIENQNKRDIEIAKIKHDTSVKIAELAKEKADSDRRRAILERDSAAIRRDIENMIDEGWTKSDDHLFMTEYSISNGLDMTEHERNQ